MIQIKTNGETLDLPKGFSIDIEDSSPVFNDRGSQSIPATVPATGRNIRILGMPHRPDTGWNPNLPRKTADISCGTYMRRGTLNITESGKTEGITFNIGFDNSTAYMEWIDRKLPAMRLPDNYCPKRDGVAGILYELYEIYQSADPEECPFAVFPVALDKQTDGDGLLAKTYWEMLNVPGDSGLSQGDSIKRMIDSEITDVGIPEGYGVSPFLRVWSVLEMIFSDIDLTIIENPFKDNLELARLVVLNNAADAVCTGSIRYSDLMPDCTAGEFMNALWVRFGLVYDIDAEKGSVRLRLLKDILENTEVPVQIEGMITAPERIVYNTPQYIRLSAATGLEGAAPANERFEDFSRGIDLENVHLGNRITSWVNNGTQTAPEWDGDMWEDYDPYEDYDDDRDYPDPWEGRDDWDDYYYDDFYHDSIDDRSSVSGTGRSEETDTGRPYADTGSPIQKRSFLAREFVTGTWHKLDSLNGRPRSTSSGFFNWDPAPEGLEPMDLTSMDECVPIARVFTVGTGSANDFNDYCPVFLTGSRHYHSYIAGDEKEEQVETPLAFMFAYNVKGGTIGRLSPEGEDGMRMTLADGSKPSVSLLFQFKDGLFARFWTRYDEILRHGNRSIEIQTRIKKNELSGIIDFLDIRSFKNIRCLIDTASYSLPATTAIAADIKLRTMQTHGDYDIKKEQNIPDFSIALRHLEWRFVSETFGDSLDTIQSRQKALEQYIRNSGYKEHGAPGDRWYLSLESVSINRIVRLDPTWATDKTMPQPYSGGKLSRSYRARLFYDIREIHDPTPEGSDDIDLSYVTEKIIGTASVQVNYTVNLKAALVPD